METRTIIEIIIAVIQILAVLFFYLIHKQKEKYNELLNKYYKNRGEIIKKYEKLIDKHVKDTYCILNKTVGEITNSKESERTKSQKELEQNKLQEKKTKDKQAKKR
jgi:transketolase